LIDFLRQRFDSIDRSRQHIVQSIHPPRAHPPPPPPRRITRTPCTVHASQRTRTHAPRTRRRRRVVFCRRPYFRRRRAARRPTTEDDARHPAARGPPIVCADSIHAYSHTLVEVHRKTRPYIAFVMLTVECACPTDHTHRHTPTHTSTLRHTPTSLSTPLHYDHACPCPHT